MRTHPLATDALLVAVLLVASSAWLATSGFASYRAAIVQTANNLESSAVVIGESSKMAPEEQAFALGQAWEALPEPKRQFVLQVVHPDGHLETFRIGPHTPTMKDEDVLLLHRLWLSITREPGLRWLDAQGRVQALDLRGYNQFPPEAPAVSQATAPQ